MVAVLWTASVQANYHSISVDETDRKTDLIIFYHSYNAPFSDPLGHVEWEKLSTEVGERRGKYKSLQYYSSQNDGLALAISVANISTIDRSSVFEALMDSNCRIKGTRHELTRPTDVVLYPPKSNYRANTDFFEGLAKAAEELHVTWNVLARNDNEAKQFKTIKDHGDNMFRVIFTPRGPVNETHSRFYSTGNRQHRGPVNDAHFGFCLNESITYSSIYTNGRDTIFLFDRKQVEQILTAGDFCNFTFQSENHPDVLVHYCHRQMDMKPEDPKIIWQDVAVGNLVYLKYPD
eukprot:GHVS01022978.1.p1 GENE.GHVS01022978.1~~GHVS01022978.1.p1  ORF type:complete len:321 (-),score=17.43 GHVS01022978.1:246-1118(-)